MNNYDFPIGADTASAPWNKEDKEIVECCPSCGSFSIDDVTPPKNPYRLFICNDCFEWFNETVWEEQDNDDKYKNYFEE